MSAVPRDRIACERNWGVPQSLVVTTLRGASLIGQTGLSFSGSGVRIEALGMGMVVEVAIEIAADAALGPRNLHVVRDEAIHLYPDVFTIVAPGRPSHSSYGMRGIGSHLL
jgi:hypothetical protein